MFVDKKSWHARVYGWWYTNKYSNRYRSSTPDSTNLCPYMRAVMFWAPLRLWFWDWVSMFTFRNTEIPMNLVTIPVTYITALKMMGYATYTGKLVMIVLGLGILALGIVITLAAALVLWAQRYKLGRKVLDKFFVPIGECLTVAVKKSRISGFFELLHALLRSAHDGVCPPVDFVEGNAEPSILT